MQNPSSKAFERIKRFITTMTANTKAGIEGDYEPGDHKSGDHYAL